VLSGRSTSLRLKLTFQRPAQLPTSGAANVNFSTLGPLADDGPQIPPLLWSSPNPKSYQLAISFFPSFQFKRALASFSVERVLTE
jgi:hypothetical protein